MRETPRGAAHGRSRQRGAVLIETALVLPLFVILVFGIIEFSVAFRSSATLADTSRSAGRAAAKVGHTEDFHTIVANAANAAVSNLPSQATPTFLIIYDADEFELPEGGFKNKGALISCDNHGASRCWTMAWEPEDQQFTPAPAAGWNFQNHNVCTPPYGRVGVAVFADFRPITNLFNPLLERTSDFDNWNPLIDVAEFSFDPRFDVSCDE